MRLKAFLLVALTAGCSVSQTVFSAVDTGNIGVGILSPPTNLTFTFTGLSAPPIFSLLYGGEFALSPAVCDSSNTSCSAGVTLTPKYAGVRTDVVIARDGNGRFLGRLPVSGTGIGPQAMVSPGIVTTLSPFSFTFNPSALVMPLSMTLDPAGNMYFTSSQSSQVFKLDTVSHSVSVVAGTTIRGYSGDGGLAINAQLSLPRAVALDRLGNLLIADGGDASSGNNVIRKVDLATGLITTAVGNGSRGLTDSGPALSASLSTPYDLAVDSSGNIYFLEGIYTQDYKVHRVDAITQTLSVVAGTGVSGNSGDNGPAVDAAIWPESLSIDPNGNVYFVQQSGSYISDGGLIRTISGGTISRYAGLDTGPTTDGSPGLATQFYAIRGLSFDAAGNSYFVEGATCCLALRTISATAPHTVTTLLKGSTVAVNFSAGNITYDPSGAIYTTDGFAFFEKILPQAAPITFPNTHSGASSLPSNLILTNTGNAPLHLSSVRLSGTNAADFSVVNSCGGVMPAGSNCTLSVTFNPQALGNRSASLVITDDAPGSPRLVAVSGVGLTAQQAVLSASSLRFATQNGGTTSPAQTVVLSNPGTAPLHITSITSTDPEFAASNNCGDTLAAGANCNISVTFTPLQNSFPSASIIITDDASGGSQYVQVTGTGTNVTVSATVSTSSVDLGIGSIYDFVSRQVAIPNTQKFTVTNTGNGWIFGFVGNIAGPDASSFGTSNNCSKVLPGQTCQVTVWFTANKAGLHSATLQLNNSYPNYSLTVGLSGMGFLQPRTVSGGAGYSRVSTDFDGDGKADIAFWRPSDGTWQIIPSSNPSQPIVRQWGMLGDVPVAGDYDGDGKGDLAVWRPSTGTWYIIPSSNPGAVIIRQWGLPGDIPVVGDFDGDGKADMTVWRQASGTWYMSPSSNPSTPITRQWGVPTDTPLAGDFDGDGKADFVVWRPSEGNWYVIPSSQPALPFITKWGAPGDTPLAADFDGDGTTDFAIWRPADGYWWIMPSGNPGALMVRQWGAAGDIPVPGDFDGDGKADYAVWRPSSAQWFILPTKSPDSQVVQNWGDRQDVILTGDFRNDGWSNIAAWQPSTGVWTVPASGDVPATIVQQWGLPGDVPLLGDFDGDGKADFTVWRPSDGTWWVLPSSHPSSPIVQQWGQPGDIPLAADVDRDGVADFVVWRPSDGTWYVLPSSDPSSPTIRQWGQNGDVPMLADFDSDMTADLTVWRPSNGTWYTIGSRSPYSLLIQQIGSSGDIPLTGRIARSFGSTRIVWRPSNGGLSFQQSSACSVPPPAQFGSPGDIPIVFHVAPVYTNSDGLELWRPTAGVAVIYPGSCFVSPYASSAPQIGTPLDRPL